MDIHEDPKYAVDIQSLVHNIKSGVHIFIILV